MISDLHSNVIACWVLKEETVAMVQRMRNKIAG